MLIDSFKFMRYCMNAMGMCMDLKYQVSYNCLYEQFVQCVFESASYRVVPCNELYTY